MCESLKKGKWRSSIRHWHHAKSIWWLHEKRKEKFKKQGQNETYRQPFRQTQLLTFSKNENLMTLCNKEVQRCYDEKFFAMLCKIEHENNGNHSKKKHEDDDVTCKMTKPCESSLGMVWWKPTCAPKKWEP